MREKKKKKKKKPELLDLLGTTVVWEKNHSSKRVHRSDR